MQISKSTNLVAEIMRYSKKYSKVQVHHHNNHLVTMMFQLGLEKHPYSILQHPSPFHVPNTTFSHLKVGDAVDDFLSPKKWHWMWEGHQNFHTRNILLMFFVLESEGNCYFLDSAPQNNKHMRPKNEGGTQTKHTEQLGETKQKHAPTVAYLYVRNLP